MREGALMKLAVFRCAVFLFALAIEVPLGAQVCNVSAGTSLNFLSYNPASGSPAIASTTATLTCTYNGTSGAQKVNWDMQVSNGSSGNCNARSLPGPVDLLSYNIYQDSVAGGVWGNAGCATFPSGQMSLSPGAGNNQKSVTHTLFGQVPTGQFVSAGTYTENLTLTVNF
jgi:spore coat protein U-like protein